MNADREPDDQPRDAYRVGFGRASGVQLGDYNVQYNFRYVGGTHYHGDRIWGDRPLRQPLEDPEGEVASPYRGLSTYERGDADFFFGRETAVRDVMERLSRQGLLVVSGVSGAGKSSLLRAGLLPRLRKDGLGSAPGSASWPCLLFTPGSLPLDELAIRVAALAGINGSEVQRELIADPARFVYHAQQAVHAQGCESGRLLLVIDQLEQLFTECRDEGQRRAFVDAVDAAVAGGDCVVVLGVRADFESDCADYLKPTSAIQDRYLLPPMTERQLRLAITGPARKMGAAVDEDLVSTLLEEVGGRQAGSRGGRVPGPGVLPLLSHALDQAWRNRAGNALTLADYERSGGIEGAVAASAERAYRSLTPERKAIARQVFLRLTTTGGDGGATAARVGQKELASSANVDDVSEVINAFVAERLLTLDEDGVQISHEVLLTAWPLLRDNWLAETRADRLIRAGMQASAAEWVRHGRDTAYLYSGSRLESAAAAAARAGLAPANTLRSPRPNRSSCWPASDTGGAGYECARSRPSPWPWSPA